MQKPERLPQTIAGAITVTGVWFLAAGLFDLPFLTIPAPGAYVVDGYAAVLIAAGLYYLARARKGQLAPQGKTIAEVRMAAVAKMQSTDLLSRIALEDDEAMVRETAARRLEEITA
jgi:hypothetical protein